MEARPENKGVDYEEDQRTDTSIDNVLKRADSLDDCEGIGDGRVGEGKVALKGDDEELALRSVISVLLDKWMMCFLHQNMLAAAGRSPRNLLHMISARSARSPLSSLACPSSRAAPVLAPERSRYSSLLYHRLKGARETSRGFWSS